MFLKSKSFGSEIFALFIDTFLNGKCGISNKYKEKMAVTKSGNTITISSGCACIRGRFVEEDTSTSLTAGTDSAYCKLVIEIDLSKENTDSQLLQVDYKILKGTDSYPSLTQTDIVANNSGVYQFELAQFRTTASGIVDFVDKRTYLDFESIYAVIQEELESIKDGSAYVLNSKFTTLQGNFNISAKSRGSIYVDFPNGFTRENCAAISVGGKFNDNSIGFAFGTDNETGNLANSAISTNVTLGLASNTEFENKINIEAYNPKSNEVTFNYKVILMKI